MARRLFVVMGWLLASGLSAQQVVTRTDGKLDFRFHLAEVHGEQDTMCTVTKVEVVISSVGNTMCVVPVDSVEFDCDVQALNNALVVEDMNFDGYSDFRIMMRPEYRDNYFQGWLFRNDRHDFVPWPALLDLSDPYFDANDHTVHSGWRLPGLGGSSIYRVINDSLVNISGVSWWRGSDQDGNERTGIISSYATPDGWITHHDYSIALNGLFLQVKLEQVEEGMPPILCRLTELNVGSSADGSFIQTLFSGNLGMWCPLFEDVPEGIELVDLNFDGALDLLVTETPRLECWTGLCWMFDTTTHRFVENDQIGSLIDPYVNNEQSTLHSGCDKENTFSTYRWENGRLLEIEREEYNEEERTMKRYALINGRLELIEETKITDP